MTKLRWHPTTGEPQVFKDDETPPDGWLTYHPADPEKAPPKPPEIGMTKAEMIEALKGGGIAPPATATAAELAGLLTTALVSNLTMRKIEYPADATVKELFDLASGK